MGTKNNPGDFDCYANADDDEPMFVLLARDRNAPATIRYWIDQRASQDGADPVKLQEAWDCAEAMDDWREQHVTQEQKGEK